MVVSGQAMAAKACVCLQDDLLGDIQLLLAFASIALRATATVGTPACGAAIAAWSVGSQQAVGDWLGCGTAAVAATTRGTLENCYADSPLF